MKLWWKSTSTTTTATTVAVSRVSSTTTIRSHLSQLGIDRWTSLTKNRDELTRLFRIVACKQGDGSSLLSSTTRSSDTMDIIFAVVGIIVINYSVDSLDIYWKLVNPTRQFPSRQRWFVSHVQKFKSRQVLNKDGFNKLKTQNTFNSDALTMVNPEHNFPFPSTNSVRIRQIPPFDSLNPRTTWNKPDIEREKYSKKRRGFTAHKTSPLSMSHQRWRLGANSSEK